MLRTPVMYTSKAQLDSSVERSSQMHSVSLCSYQWAKEKSDVPAVQTSLILLSDLLLI